MYIKPAKCAAKRPRPITHRAIPIRHHYISECLFLALPLFIRIPCGYGRDRPAGPGPTPGPVLHRGGRAATFRPGQHRAAGGATLVEPPNQQTGTAARCAAARPHTARHHAHGSRRGLPPQGKDPVAVGRSGRSACACRGATQPPHGRVLDGDHRDARRITDASEASRRRYPRHPPEMGRSAGRTA
ncbi:Uncharacterised protein [Mycobacteroides abscessus subsp. abscessus]|nr:Uncharacterised protein [Mycobacteroides abscessus subsp. abscessus]